MTLIVDEAYTDPDVAALSEALEARERSRRELEEARKALARSRAALSASRQEGDVATYGVNARAVAARRRKAKAARKARRKTRR